MVIALKSLYAGLQDLVRSLLREVCYKAYTAGVPLPLINGFWRHGLSLLSHRRLLAGRRGSRHHKSAPTAQRALRESRESSRITQEMRRGRSAKPLLVSQILHVVCRHGDSVAYRTSQNISLFEIYAQLFLKRFALRRREGRGGTRDEGFVGASKGGTARHLGCAPGSTHVGGDFPLVELGVLHSDAGLLRPC